ELEKISDRLPIVEGELNFVFTGCYTTQSRIKTANRIGEAKLDEAEAACAMAANFLPEPYPAPDFEESWRKLLFNQFHDILPGSGVVDTREYAMGEFQKILAYANTGMTSAYRNIAKNINTASLLPAGEASDSDRSEGGGAGFGLAGFGIPHAERGRGINRIFHVFNPTQYERKEIIELTVWDWEGDTGRIGFVDSKGGQVRHQLAEDGRKQYWGHEYIRILLEASVQPYGYSTYLMTEAEAVDVNVAWPPWPRLETPDDFILENDWLRAVFNDSMGLVSLIEKEKGTELVDGKRGAGGFRFIMEDDTKGMTAWVVGRHMKSELLSDNIRIKEVRTENDGLRKWLKYEQDFRNSKLKVKVSLDSTAARLDFEVECDWQEKGTAGKGIPQLAYKVPVNYKCLKYKYDVPFGTVKRGPLDHDVPANSWMAAIPQYGNKSLALVSNSRYGFRGMDDSMSLSLIRSSYDPDPYPDNGLSIFRFSLGPVMNTSRREYIKYAYTFNHPSNYMPGTAHGGGLQPDGSFLELEKGSIVISSLKKAEGVKNGIMLRVYETEGLGTKAGVRFIKEPTKAYFTDIHENETEGLVNISKDRIEFGTGAYEVKTVIVEF
ncbi:MAG: alpha-mannosidase, partial [Clostridia bacterium]|nr:alpha-mannosidase [Clostridia bacterium]